MEDRFPASFQISRQLDQEKINFLTRRVEELITSNNDLRTSSGQNEKDTHDIVIYFQREMEIKDDVILKLNEELVKCQTQLKFEVEKVRKTFEEELGEIRTTSETTITMLTEKLDACESELKAVYSFKQAKDQHEGTIARLEKNLQQQREQLIDAMEEQERRFLEEKSALYKTLEEEKAAFREVALKEARSAMGEEAKKILADNNRMFEELKFHHNEAADMQAEKATLVASLTTAKRDITIFAEKEIEYAKQAHMRTKEIKALRERVEQLEKQQTENLERFKVRAKELKTSVSKELQEATLDAAGLRRLLQIKNKELKHMKSLAATILGQRTEVETFFLEALQEVKEVIKKERHLSAVEQRKALNKLRGGAGANKEPLTLSQQLMNPIMATGMLDDINRQTEDSMKGKSGTGGVVFPPLNVKGANLHLIEARQPSDLPLADMKKLAIRDLSWDDKELVLRVLFAKMNGSSAQATHDNMRNMMSMTNHQGVRIQEPMPEPVFLSEGANLPRSAGAAAYQENFEVVMPGSANYNHSLGSSRPISSGAGGVHVRTPTHMGESSHLRKQGSGKDLVNRSRSNDPYGFEAIGGGSLHSSQFSALTPQQQMQQQRASQQQQQQHHHHHVGGNIEELDLDQQSIVASSLGSKSR